MKEKTVEIGLVEMQCPKCKKETQHSVEKSDMGVMNECSVCGTQHGTLHFGLGDTGGDLITNLVRQVAWWESNRDRAILMLLKSFQGLEIHHAEQIIDGEFKLVTKDRGTVEMVKETDWKPPYAEIEEANKVINDAFAYISFPTGKKVLGGTWFNHLPEVVRLQLHNEAIQISKLRQTNIWEAKHRASFLHEWALEEMRKNAVLMGEKFKSVKETKEKRFKRIKEREKMFDDTLDLLKAEAMTNIALSDMPMEEKERLLRITDGQVDAMKGKVKIEADTEFKFDTGWLTTDGTYYGCKPGQHIELSRLLAEKIFPKERKEQKNLKDGEFFKADRNPEEVLERNCWIKCTGKKWFYSGQEKLTPEQIGAIRGWAKVWGEPIWWNGSEVSVSELARYRGRKADWNVF